MMEECKRVGGKKGEGTINWLEPRSQGRIGGRVIRGGGTARKAMTIGQFFEMVGMEGAFSGSILLN